ncbi:hypothetical protein IKF34_00615 [Candidatus Saccharibacteria bacterium]|nr:hypothetical protein [Candidatus Saccharibacteria bacterium]
MKRIPKKVVGLFGLLAVIVVTIFAAAIPGTGVLATSTSSVTDTIVVRVIEAGPSVIITSPKNGGVSTSPSQTVSYDYENVTRIKITVDYIDKDGKLHAYIIDDFATDAQAGSGKVDLDLTDERFSYGEYIVRIFAIDDKGVTKEDAVKFSYYPFTATIEDNDETGDPDVVLDYDKDNDDIERFEINIYDEDGNLVKPSPIKATPPTDRVGLPFADYNLPKGKYRIEISAYKGSDELYNKVILYYDYTPIPLPNTGSFLKNLNISQSDFIISALIIFFAISLGSIVFIVKQKNARK